MLAAEYSALADALIKAKNVISFVSLDRF